MCYGIFETVSQYADSMWLSACGWLECCLRCDNFECACASLRYKSQIVCTFVLVPLRERCNT